VRQKKGCFYWKVCGTGKSSTWWSFYAHLIKGGKKYFVAVSPTNKAVGVLEKIAPKHLRNKVEFATIHSLLGLTAEIDNEARLLNLSRDVKEPHLPLSILS